MQKKNVRMRKKKRADKLAEKLNEMQEEIERLKKKQK